MGLHLSVMTRRGEEHPDWDWVRHAGDEEFVGLNLPKQEIQPEPMFFLWRPTDFQQWREAIADFPNPNRFRWLLETLEANPEQWVYVSW